MNPATSKKLVFVVSGHNPPAVVLACRALRCRSWYSLQPAGARSPSLSHRSPSRERLVPRTTAAEGSPVLLEQTGLSEQLREAVIFQVMKQRDAVHPHAEPQHLGPFVLGVARVTTPWCVTASSARTCRARCPWPSPAAAAGVRPARCAVWTWRRCLPPPSSGATQTASSSRSTRRSTRPGLNGGQSRGAEGARHAVSNADFFKNLSVAGNKSAVSSVLYVRPLAKRFSRFFVNLFSFSGV